MKILHIISFVLVIVGGLNWGLVAIDPSYNLVHMILGSWPMVETLVYALVGLAAIALLVSHKKDCKMCSMEGM